MNTPAGNLIVRLGMATEELNHVCTGPGDADIQPWSNMLHRGWVAPPWTGQVKGPGGFEAKYLLPRSSGKVHALAAAQWVVAARQPVPSVMTRGRAQMGGRLCPTRCISTSSSPRNAGFGTPLKAASPSTVRRRVGRPSHESGRSASLSYRVRELHCDARSSRGNYCRTLTVVKQYYASHSL